jgi:hypothetical protein
MTRAKEAEPPSWLQSLPFMVGQDQHGNWVVQEQNGIRGGLFVDRDAALRFVRSENGGRPQAVIMISGILELDMTCKPAAAPPCRQVASDALQLRRVA